MGQGLPGLMGVIWCVEFGVATKIPGWLGRVMLG
jgi:hypothetical protein